MSGIAFTVYGVAQPKGSARAFIPKGWKRPIVTSDNPSLKTWETTIRGELQRVMSDPATDRILFDAPIRLTLEFHLPRPKSTPRALYPTKRPDLDKCVRAVVDALSGVAFNDDKQVVSIAATKQYTNAAACVHIEITEYAPTSQAGAEDAPRNASLL